jgi:hypothetical protein
MNDLGNGRTKTLEDLQFELYNTTKPTNERLIGIFREVQEFEVAQPKNSRALQAGTFPTLKAGVLKELAKDPKTPTEILQEVFKETKNIEDIKTKGIILKNIASNPNTPSAVLGAIANDMNQVQNLANYQPNRQAILTALAANPNTPSEVKQKVQNSIIGQDSKIGANPNTAESSQGKSFVAKVMNSIGLGSNQRTR